MIATNARHMSRLEARLSTGAVYLIKSRFHLMLAKMIADKNRTIKNRFIWMKMETEMPINVTPGNCPPMVVMNCVKRGMQTKFTYSIAPNEAIAPMMFNMVIAMIA